MEKILRIEDKNRFGFETSIHDKRKKHFDDCVRFGFIYTPYTITKSDGYKYDVDLTEIEHIQLYIAITQYLDFLPLYPISKKLLVEDNGRLIRFTTISEEDFVKELELLGFAIYEYHVPKELVKGHDKFKSNEIAFYHHDEDTNEILYKKRKKYKPKHTEEVKIIEPKEDNVWNLKGNRDLTRDKFY